MRLGKLAPRHDSRTLKLARYTAALPDPPTSCDLTAKVARIGMMLNDSLGDCTCAAIGHIIQCWTAENGAEVILPDSDILSLYEAACGYNPADPSTDQGGVELDVLNYWRKTGVAGHTLGAYAILQKRAGSLWGKLLSGTSWRHDVMRSVYYFGAAYIGVALPDAVITQLDKGNVIPWEFPADKDASWNPNPDNGHAICIVAYDADGVVIVTWGQLLTVSWDFLDACMDEGYCPFSKDIVNAVSGKSPQNFALAQLQTDLNAVTA
jgi:hypothetical protein